MPIENPSVREYLLKRKAEREALEGQLKEEASGPNFSAGLASLGAGFMGKDAAAAGQAVLNRQDSQRKQKLAEFDSADDRHLKGLDASNTADKMDRENQRLSRETDPNSQESKMAFGLAQQMGYKGAPITAAQFKDFSPIMQKKYEIEQRKLDRDESRAERRFLSGMKTDQALEKRDETDVQRLSKDIGGVQDMINSLDEVQNELGFKLDDADATNGLKVGGKEVDLPGVSVPGLGRVSVHDDKAQRLQSAASKVFNSVLKDRSGAAISNTELERLKTEFGEGKFNTEPQMVAALQRFKRLTDQELANREAGYRPEVVDKYSERGGRTSRSGKSMAEKTVKMTDPSGRVKEVPESMVEAALANGGKLYAPTAGR